MLVHKYYCPGCDQEKLQDSITLVRPYSAGTAQLPYFYCSVCRLIYIDRQLIREILSGWRNRNPSAKKISYKKIYEEMLAQVESTVELYCRTAGYKRAKFKKVKS